MGNYFLDRQYLFGHIKPLAENENLHNKSTKLQAPRLRQRRNSSLLNFAKRAAGQKCPNSPRYTLNGAKRVFYVLTEIFPIRLSTSYFQNTSIRQCYHLVDLLLAVISSKFVPFLNYDWTDL